MISASTLRTYLSVLRSFRSRQPMLRWKDDPQRTIEALLGEERPTSSKATLLAALYYETGLKAFHTAMLVCSRAIQATYQEQKTELPRPSQDHVRSIALQLLDDVAADQAFNVSANDLQFAILACLCSGAFEGCPPRRLLDWTEMKCVKDDDKDDENYMILGVDGVYAFVFNRYKTAKTYGTSHVTIPVPLRAPLEKLVALRAPHAYLFATQTGAEKLTQSSLSLLLKGIFGFSVNGLRSVYLSNMYKDMPPLKQMEETATAMGHSVPAALGFYVKRD